MADNWDELPKVDGVLGEIESHLPRPALVKATVFSVVSLFGVILGKDLSVPYLDTALDAYALAVPAVFGWWVNRRLNPPPLDGYEGKHRAGE